MWPNGRSWDYEMVSGRSGGSRGVGVASSSFRKMGLPCHVASGLAGGDCWGSAPLKVALVIWVVVAGTQQWEWDLAEVIWEPEFSA